MDFDMIDEFVSTVIEKIDPDQRNLCFAVNFTLELSEERSIPPKLLLDLADACRKQKMPLEEYVFAKACTRLASG
ncbi:hypothetical protein [Methanosarcina sp. KYL-1]|uniref:hypothetical protein n=1 Tax=Methanosarcina sp. KYL-1 TaxID=2602068 RepID=UPI0021018A7B|nr:hypothetical protein [Methanosarcina sp. KYL-1]